MTQFVHQQSPRIEGTIRKCKRECNNTLGKSGHQLTMGEVEKAKEWYDKAF